MPRRRPHWCQNVAHGLRLLADPALFPLPQNPDEARAVEAARSWILRMDRWRSERRKEKRNAKA